MNYPDATDPLWKVRPLLYIFQSKCKSLAAEERHCIDKQMVPFKGRLDIKQYVKGKPHPWDIKLFMLYCKAGLICDFLPYQASITKVEDSVKQQYGVTGAFSWRNSIWCRTQALFSITILHPCHCSVKFRVKNICYGHCKIKQMRKVASEE